MKFKILFILLLWTTSGYAGDFFKAGSRICFIGNSITHSGDFHHNILLFHVTRFPDMPMSFFNLKLIERSVNFKNCPEKENPALVKSCMEKFVTNPYILKRLEDYTVNKPIQEDLEREQDKLRLEAYEVARPVAHRFSLTRIH